MNISLIKLTRLPVVREELLSKRLMRLKIIVMLATLIQMIIKFKIHQQVDTLAEHNRQTILLSREQMIMKHHDKQCKLMDVHHSLIEAIAKRERKYCRKVKFMLNIVILKISSL